MLLFSTTTVVYAHYIYPHFPENLVSFQEKILAEAAAEEDKARKEAEEERRLKEEQQRLEEENRLREERVKAREGEKVNQLILNKPYISLYRLVHCQYEGCLV